MLIPKAVVAELCIVVGVVAALLAALLVTWLAGVKVPAGDAPLAVTPGLQGLVDIQADPDKGVGKIMAADDVWAVAVWGASPGLSVIPDMGFRAVVIEMSCGIGRNRSTGISAATRVETVAR